MELQWVRLRQRSEAAIEYLLQLLDHVDGDADVEESGDLEPSLGALERHPGCSTGESWYDAPFSTGDGAQTAWSRGARDDREGEHDGAEPDVDDELSGDEGEPWLGSSVRMADQDKGWRQTQGRHWAQHSNADLEAEPATR